MAVPTRPPRTTGSIREITHAAIGAAMDPPMSRASTAERLATISCHNPTTKPRVAPSVTKNSAVFTVPTMRRGCSRPIAMSVEVETGPQPPPPVESTKPPTEPSPIKNGVEWLRFCTNFARRGREKRQMRLLPMATKMSAVIGAAASVEILESTVAPINAAMAPGTPSRKTVFQSTLPKRAWLRPDIAVVPSSAVWTTAEAWAGPRPARRRMVVEVTPKPMPMPPSTSWAAAPATAIKIRVSMEHRPPGRCGSEQQRCQRDRYQERDRR